MSEKPLKVIAGSPDSPLRIAGFEIPCYVLEDETRVLTQTGMFAVLGIARRGLVTTEHGAQIPRFAASKAINPFVSKDLTTGLSSPILFRYSGSTAYGLVATILPDTCEAVLKARDAETLNPQQKNLAKQCDLLMRALAHVGIIALVDEATGYDKIRSRNALIKILEEFIAKELQPYTRTFPYSFYEEICKLRGWPGYYAVKRPHKIAEYTDDFVYSRIAPGVLKKLRKINPVDPETGHRKAHHHRWFTEDIGHPKLRAHIEAVTALMRAASNMTKFKSLLQRAYPNKYDNFMLAFMDDEE